MNTVEYLIKIIPLVTKKISNRRWPVPADLTTHHTQRSIRECCFNAKLWRHSLCI